MAIICETDNPFILGTQAIAGAGNLGVGIYSRIESGIVSITT